MIRTLIKFGFLLVVGILIYNFLFGTSQEKAQSKEVFQKTGAAVSSAWNLLKSERQKFDAGKYDNALSQLGNAYREVRDRAKYLDENILSRVGDLERRKTELEQELEGIESGDSIIKTAPPAPTKKGVKATAPAQPSAAEQEQQRKKEKLMRELDSLMKDTDQLLKEAQNQ